MLFLIRYFQFVTHHRGGYTTLVRISSKMPIVVLSNINLYILTGPLKLPRELGQKTESLLIVYLCTIVPKNWFIVEI